MVSEQQRLTAAEIAKLYNRSVTTVQTHWMQWPDWPAPVGKRGRWHEFDAGEVKAVVEANAERTDPPAGKPGDLLTALEIAEYTGRARGTIRSDISRGRLGDEDEVDAGGVKRWKRSTVDAVFAARREYRKSSTE